MTRRYLAEFIGTFAIVFFGCGSILVTPAGQVAPLLVNTVFGLTVATMICALGHISAAHFNPAVTLAFASTRKFPWRYVPGYVTAQVAGAVFASGLHLWLLQGKAAASHFGATIPTVSAGPAVVTEVVLTFFLMLVIMAAATDRRVNGALPGIAIGATVTLCGLFGGPITGCSMNPARSLGPALFAGAAALRLLWIYVAGPITGALLAGAIYELLRGDTSTAKRAPDMVEDRITGVPGSR